MWRRRTKNFQFSARRVGARQKGENNLFFFPLSNLAVLFPSFLPPPLPRVLCELFMKARVEKGRRLCNFSLLSRRRLSYEEALSLIQQRRPQVRKTAPLLLRPKKRKTVPPKKREEKEKVSCFQDTTQFPQPSFPSSSSKQACPNSGFAQQLRLYRLMGWRLDASSPAFKCYRLKCVQVRTASLFCFDLDAAAQKKFILRTL